MTVKDFVDQQNQAYFSYYRAGVLYYIVKTLDTGEQYSFPVPADDLGGATVSHTEKAITLMRWIRKAIDEGMIIKEQ